MQDIDRINASLMAARCCDALEPCADCQEKARVIREARRHGAPSIPAPRKPSSLAERLAAARA